MPIMDKATFWGIIDSTRQAAAKMPRGKNEEINFPHERALADALSRLSPEEIVAFNERFWTCHAEAYRWDLWAVAYWMHGGCSDDGFTDFRACLISLGRERFERALKDADSLAEIVGLPDMPYMQVEGFQYIALRAYKKATGEDIPLGEGSGMDEPAGEQFDFDDEEEMRARFPKLLEKMPEMGD